MTREDYEAHKEDYKDHNVSSGAFVLIQDVYISILEAQLKAIAELEAQEAKSCEGCKFNGQKEDIYIFPCDYCLRNYDDRYEPKDT